MKILYTLPAVALLSGCALFNQPVAASEQPLAELSGSWQVVQINGQAPMNTIELNFDNDEQAFTGTDGCNRLFGNYQLTEGVFTAVGASTRMACEPEVMEQASVVNTVMQNARALAREQQTLLVTDEHQLVLEQLP